MYATLTIHPAQPASGAAAPAEASGEGAGFGDALRRAVAGVAWPLAGRVSAAAAVPAEAAPAGGLPEAAVDGAEPSLPGAAEALIGQFPLTHGLPDKASKKAAAASDDILNSVDHTATQALNSVPLEVPVAMPMAAIPVMPTMPIPAPGVAPGETGVGGAPPPVTAMLAGAAQPDPASAKDATMTAGGSVLASPLPSEAPVNAALQAAPFQPAADRTDIAKVTASDRSELSSFKAPATGTAVEAGHAAMPLARDIVPTPPVALQPLSNLLLRQAVEASADPSRSPAATRPQLLRNLAEPVAVASSDGPVTAGERLAAAVMPWRPGGHPTTPGVGIAAASPLGAALAATEHPEAEILIEAPTAAAQALLSNAVPLAIAVTPSHTSPRPAGTADTTVPVAAPEAAMPTIPATMVVNAEAARSAPRAASLPPSRQVLPMAVALLVSPGASPTLSVTLEPAELGRLQIRVSRDSSGASLRLIAERPETLTLLARDQRELQQGLTQSGIALNVDGISFEMAGDGGQPRQDPQPAPRGRPPLREAAGAAPPADTAGAVSSLLDMRV